jgi:Tol biopolymer transport system component
MLAMAVCGAVSAEDLVRPGEKHFGDMRQLTFGGENAEAYFSGDDKRLIFQSTRDDFECDQIYVMNTDGGDVRLISDGRGRTTCAFFHPLDDRIIYASTFMADTLCPPPPSMSEGYVWATYSGYDNYYAKPDGSDLTVLASSDGYDAEAVFSRDGSMIAFTSKRDGDLEIYVMNSDGSDIRRVTHYEGYDGGAFFSPNGKRLVFRAQRFFDDEQRQEYRDLLSKDLVKPSRMEIFIINIDGTDRRQITDNGAANFAPYYHPSGEKIIFSSDIDHPREHNFELYLIGTDGENLERVTYSDEFDGFPMFSYGGTRLVFASNRNNASPRETNIFIVDWVD